MVRHIVCAHYCSCMHTSFLQHLEDSLRKAIHNSINVIKSFCTIDKCKDLYDLLNSI